MWLLLAISSKALICLSYLGFSTRFVMRKIKGRCCKHCKQRKCPRAIFEMVHTSDGLGLELKWALEKLQPMVSKCCVEAPRVCITRIQNDNADNEDNESSDNDGRFWDNEQEKVVLRILIFSQLLPDYVGRKVVVAIVESSISFAVIVKRHFFPSIFRTNFWVNSRICYIVTSGSTPSTSHATANFSTSSALFSSQQLKETLETQTWKRMISLHSRNTFQQYITSSLCQIDCC